jgi:hypothetical protein
MENDYFDEKLKRILENAPQFEPTADDLLDMQNRLAGIRAKAAPKSGWWTLAWLLPLFLLLFLLLSLFFIQKINRLEKAIGLLEAKTLKNQTVQVDTIFEKRTIYQIDTVYHLVYRTSYEDLPSSWYSAPKPSLFQAFITSEHHVSTNPASTPLERLLRPYQAIDQLAFLETRANSSQQKPGEGEVLNETTLFDKTALFDPFPLLLNPQTLKPYHPTNYQLLALGDFNFSGTKAKQNRWPDFYYFVPQNISLGLQLSPLLLPTHGYGGSAFNVGVHLVLGFPGKRSMRLGAELLSMDFELKNPEQFTDFPSNDPDQPSAILSEIKPQINYLQVPFVLQQEFYLGPTLNLSLGAGLVALRPVKQTIKYEYISPGGEYYENRNFNDSDFTLNNLRFLLGLNYEINSHLSLEANWLYQRALTSPDDQFFPLNYWALELGTKYSF